MSFNFGGSSNTAGTERKTGTLFGSTTAPPGGLFAKPQQGTSAPTQTPSLFGNAATNTTNTANTTQTPSLFGNTQTKPTLFGNTTTNQGTSLFGNPQQQNTASAPAAGASVFGNTLNQQQQQQQNALNNSIFGGKLQPAPSLPALQAQQLQQSQNGLPQLRQTANAQFANTLVGQREKSVLDQILVLEKKWNFVDPDCVFQYYFYNQVKPEEAPFYGPAPHEDHTKWEGALSKKPNSGAIPVLARGFQDIAARIELQNLAVAGLRTRLHEINNSLNLMKSNHELEVASRIAEAKRKHVVNTQRTLALASKVQYLRNRGYAMDQAEEELKKKLVDLEKKTFDPVLTGRQEEIWARMSGVRERARMLQAETERLGKTVDGVQSGKVLSEEDQKQIDKLLRDYDKQLEHLKKSVDETCQEYDEWESMRRSMKPSR